MAGPKSVQASAPNKGSLGRRATKAGGWVVFQMLIQNILRLASNLIMTRLLMPEAFGLIALVSALIIGFTLLTDIGIQRSIIREKDGDTDAFLHTAWIVKIGRGALITGGILFVALLLYLLAPTLAARALFMLIRDCRGCWRCLRLRRS